MEIDPIIFKLNPKDLKIPLIPKNSMKIKEIEKYAISTGVRFDKISI
jgi:hypothetical protein|tara:strand:- start:1725 stop:1865 length:141 start_codon:yes stop_codon:yes gene_type:complete